jgi:hypothetical protein
MKYSGLIIISLATGDVRMDTICITFYSSFARAYALIAFPPA